MSAPVKLLTETNKNTKSVFHHQLSNIDQLAEQLHSLGQVKLSQMSANSLHSHVAQVSFDPVHITFMQFSCPIHVLGEKLKDRVTFSFGLTPDSPGIISHSCKLSSDAIADFNPDIEFNAILPPNIWRITIQIQRDVLEEYLQVMGRFDLDVQFWATNAVIASATLPALRLYLTQILDLAGHQPHCLQQPSSRSLIIQDLIPLLINTLPLSNTKSLQPPTPLVRSRLVQQADDYMMSHLDQPLTLKDLCNALGVSRRPLFYGFEEMFGTTPMEYLKAKRLQGARQMLKAANPKTTTVAAIVQKFGFWSKGHFARDYKTMFGELPTETLNGRKLKRHLTPPVTDEAQ
jgi:AraC family transcriptional regulator, ethanolamine operon transcriptional activator